MNKYIYQILIIGLLINVQNAFAQKIIQEKWNVTFQEGKTNISPNQLDTTFEAINQKISQVGRNLVSISLGGKTSLENHHLYSKRLEYLGYKILERNISNQPIQFEKYGLKEGNINQITIIVNYEITKKISSLPTVIQLDSNNIGLFVFKSNENIIVKTVNNTIIQLNTIHIKNADKGEPISIEVKEYLSPKSIYDAQIRTSLRKKIARVGSIIFIKFQVSRRMLEIDGCLSVSFDSPQIEHITPIFTRQSKMFKKELNTLNWLKVSQEIKPTTSGYQIKFCGKIMGYLGVSAGEITKEITSIEIKGIKNDYSNIHAFVIYSDSTISKIDAHHRKGTPTQLPLFSSIKTAHIMGSYRIKNSPYIRFQQIKDGWHQYRLNQGITFSFNKKGVLENRKDFKRLTFELTSYSPVVQRYFKIPWWKEYYL